MPDPLPISESCLQEQDPRLQAQFEKASTALKNGNHEYALQVADVWVKNYPNVPEFRVLLREAQLHKYYPDQQYYREFKSLNPAWLTHIIPRSRDLTRALFKCEMKLADDPLNRYANIALADIARELQWIQTEIHALQTVLLHPKRRPDEVIRLTKLLISQHQLENALDVCNTFLKIFPDHSDLQALRDQISIQQSMDKVDS